MKSSWGTISLNDCECQETVSPCASRIEGARASNRSKECVTFPANLSVLAIPWRKPESEAQQADVMPKGAPMSKNMLCGGIIRGRLCNYPINIEEDPNGGYDYKDNDPKSANYGHAIQICPRCGERFYLWTEHSDHQHPRW